MKTFTTSLFCAVWLLGCSQGDTVHPIAAIVGTNLFSTLEHPTRVEAFLVKPRADEGAPPFDRSKAGEYPIRTGPLVLPTNLATNISAILCNPKTYVPPGGPGNRCAPQYGVRLKFVGATGSVDVLICLECNILAFAPEGTVADDKDFDPGRPQIVRFLKQVFPDDKLIQLQKEVRRPGDNLQTTRDASR